MFLRMGKCSCVQSPDIFDGAGMNQVMPNQAGEDGTSTPPAEDVDEDDTAEDDGEAAALPK